ncbi:MAG: T9SS type A sorting domain-containing protein [Bacteroidetes bacterium]|nr:T9SS type A sorting domain-containing protein [Bacteroidota bacterium]
MKKFLVYSVFTVIVSLSLFAQQNISIALRDTSIRQNQIFKLPIYLFNTSDDEISSVQFSVRLENSQLTFVDVLTDETLTQTWPSPEVITEGEYPVVMADGTEWIHNSGILMYLQVKVSSDAVDPSSIELVNIYLNDTISVAPQSCVITPIIPPSITIFNLPQFAAIGESFTAAASGGTPPYRWRSSNPAVAAIDSLTGKFSALSKGSTDIRAVDFENFDGIITVSVRNIRTGFNDTTITPNDTLSIPFLIPNLSGSGILSHQLTIRYNSSVIQFLGVQQQGTLSQNALFEVHDSYETIRLAIASAAEISGPGVLFRLKFKPLVASGNSALNVTEYTVNENEPDVLSIAPKDANIIIQQPVSNNFPYFISVPHDTTITAGTSYSFTVTAADPDNDPLIYSIQNSPSGMNIDHASGVISWTPTKAQTGIHPFLILVSDGKGGLAQKQVTITVVQATNSLPEFSHVPADTTILVDSIFTFQYEAFDVDGDRVSFSFISAPSSALLTSDGKLSWRPSASEIGDHRIIVAVSDGNGSVTDTVMISVIGYPKFSAPSSHIPFGTIPLGSKKSVNIIIRNEGYLPLVLEYQMPMNFFGAFTVENSLVVIQAGKDSVIQVSFTPQIAGTQSAVLHFSTNDKRFPLVTFVVEGSAVSSAPIQKKILIDRFHSSVPLNDSLFGFTKLFSSLQSSGFTVRFGDSAFSPAELDAVLLISPEKIFSSDEISSLIKFVQSGGTLIAMGNAFNWNENSIINLLLSDTAWNAIDGSAVGISLNSTAVYDSERNYQAEPLNILLTQFADARNPFFKGIDSLVMFGSAGITTTSGAVPLMKTSPGGYADETNQPTMAAHTFDNNKFHVLNDTNQTNQPVVAAMRSLGKGKILVFGDADMWRNGEFAQNISAEDNLLFAMNIFSVTENYHVAMPDKTPLEQYRMISIPFDLASTEIKSVLKDLGEPGPFSWRLFGKWNSKKGAYAEYPSQDFSTFQRGEAYWLITKSSHAVTYGSATVVPSQEFYPIKVPPGFSMIGNPFPYTVSWQQSKHDSLENILWEYDGKGFKSQSLVLEPFTGYFVKNLAKDSVTIFINPLSVSVEQENFHSKLNKLQNSFAEKEWIIQLAVKTPSAVDEDNVIGVSRFAKKEWDEMDISEPPTTPSGYVTLSFNRSGWEKNPGMYAVDMRPITNEGDFWDFSVACAEKGKTVHLTTESFGNLPADFDIYLVDRRTERVQKLPFNSAYDFAMSGNETYRNFRIIVGRKEFAEKNSSGIPLTPQTFSLQQNYPNPFNPSTTIRYTLGHSGYVTVGIYNLLGQKIRTLVSSNQSIGTYETVWDAKNDAGLPVASGLYFYRIHSAFNEETQFVETKKMLLMR